MTREEFMGHLRAIDSSLVDQIDHFGLPRLCDNLALNCFVEKRVEDEHTDALRQQLISLHITNGHFLFEEER